jgi:hypothetical protein
LAAGGARQVSAHGGWQQRYPFDATHAGGACARADRSTRRLLMILCQEKRLRICQALIYLKAGAPRRSLRAVLTVIPPSAVDCLATSLSIYLRKPCDWPLFYFLICPLPSSDGLAYTVASHRPSRLNLNSVGPRINATSPPARQPRRPILLAVGVSSRQDLSRKPRNMPPTTCSFSRVSSQGLPINLPLFSFSQTLRKWAAIVHDPLRMLWLF